MNAYQNFPLLKGQQTNLFRCFLPQAWSFNCDNGVSGLLHPDGIYDDPKGQELRKQVYTKLCFHFQFENELNLFEGTNDHGRMRFSINIYRSGKRQISFYTINNLFLPATIEECINSAPSDDIPGIKTDDNKWNTKGSSGRVLQIGINELTMFSKLFDDGENPKSSRLPNIHAKPFLETLQRMSNCEDSLEKHSSETFSSLMWDETNANKNHIISRNIHFPECRTDAIFSGAHIGVLNPFYKCMRRDYKSNNDYDSIDLSCVGTHYLQRCMYSIGCDFSNYNDCIPKDDQGIKYTANYRLFVRKMLNQNGERTLIGSIMPPDIGHINGILGFTFKNNVLLVLVSALFASLPFDFFIKIMGRNNFYRETANQLPIINNTTFCNLLINRALMLNCITGYYSDLWNEINKTNNDEWSKNDSRLRPEVFEYLQKPWSTESSVRGCYQRRQLLVEIDVLCAMGLRMTLQQLKTIYSLQFPVLKTYESDTWYDSNGRIVFTNNRSLTNVGFSRSEWENGIKGAPAGQKFYRTITDDTMPGGPVERTIEYVAPFDRCDREQDYETAWRFFEEKYGENQ